jgi:hypothetical protein
MKIIEDGTLKGTFKGFKNRETIFTFTNGSKWQQDEFKYHYFYANKPHAKVIKKPGYNVLEVDGMNDSVKVTRVRKQTFEKP